MEPSVQRDQGRRRGLPIRETVIFALLGALMFCAYVITQALPNLHLLGMFTMTYTVVYRKKALIPIYIYVFLNGLYAGFSVWWLPYLYIWTILWGVTMLLPRRMPKKFACVLYPAVCCLHGLAFGTLYAPAAALISAMDWDQTLAWIVAGLPFDLIQGIGNLLAGLLIVPLSAFLTKLENAGRR